MDSAKYSKLKANDSIAAIWLQEQMEPGIKSDSTTMYFSKEVKRLMSDKAHRDSTYRNPYTFLDVSKSLQAMNIRLAFWQMLNLYPTNKQQVMQYILAYDDLIASDKLLASSFYTYALLDPRITRIENNKPVIEHPDVMDEIFHNMNQIIDYTLQYRASKPPKTGTPGTPAAQTPPKKQPTPKK